ncbi:hypothetical protein DLAC_01616 [Tieghemostelium lacteum]|uniref:B box-type domain-containing protein n=1 Tax=Tieghemostelium lacteum TaxID=361077 RepID=A0A152A5V5_TIELA|nr:hypothetical protein DLAC_01616 [Tieghemostelium lacteum]|eukprot:KYR01616.1 hypothetical protein DLAC_01616 [Tieghemostelium lacteum]
MSFVTKLFSSSSSSTPKECTADKHLKNPDLYCNQCKNTCCSKCFKSHSSHADKIVDIDQILSDSSVSNNIEGIIKFIDINKTKSIEIQQEFQSTIDTEYQEELLKITNYFKQLHDALHYREVDLKRELKSHYDENQEHFVTLTSALESNVHKCQEIISTLKDSNDNADVTIKKFNEFRLICIEAQKQLNITDNLFVPHKFKEAPVTEFDNLMGRNYIRSQLKGQQEKNQSIYMFYGTELKKFDLKTKKLELVPGISIPAGEKKLDSIWQSMCSTDKHLYIFSKAKWYKYEPESKVWSVKAMPMDNGGYQPVFYDGKKYIYILGGYINAVFHLNVHRFDITTEEFEMNFTTLNSGHQNTPFIINGDENQIYLCGGYHNKDTDALDIIDVEKKTVRTFRHFAPDGFPNLTSGCYIPFTDSIYMITREYLFFRFDMKEQKSYALSNPKGNSYYNRLLFDGDNTIYLISTKLKIMYEYNINTNVWSTTINDNFSPTSAYGSTLSPF